MEIPSVTCSTPASTDFFSAITRIAQSHPRSSTIDPG
jgi:hypothetical protein